MNAGQFRTRRRRRGVVLVLILGMLGLLALIGVTFATFSGQAQVGARYYSEALSFPDSEQVMDFALSQLINDTNNPVSALRGHSLKRDMYGWDGSKNGLLTAEVLSGSPLTIQTVTTVGGQLVLATNIPDSFAYASYDFTGWVVRLESRIVPSSTQVQVSQTFEVFNGTPANVTGGYRLLTLSQPSDGSFAYSSQVLSMNQPLPGTRFVLDGRFRRAFNGAGINGMYDPYGYVGTPYPNPAQYANFRYNGKLLSNNPAAFDYFDFLSPPYSVGNVAGTPSVPAVQMIPSMDEDYDAADLENWFLAIKSADGSIEIPSFHRPGILRYQTDTSGAVLLDDWRDINNLDATIDPDPALVRLLKQRSRILRPRQVDHPASGLPDLHPDPKTGRLTYDVDNDGDGKAEGVWLDLGYPIQRDPSGKMFKPLFSFTVIGQNGRLPLNTAGNLQGSYPADVWVIDPTGTNPPARTHYAGDPTFNHTSHLGYSPNEINPKFALQNAPDTGPQGPSFSQVDNVGLGVPQTDVSVTQLRNLLAGTRPPLNPNVGPTAPPNNGTNGDANAVLVAGNPFYLPNGMSDGGDLTGTSGYVERNTPPVPGRWGEAEAVPGPVHNTAVQPLAGLPVFSNRVRAGRSLVYNTSTATYTSIDLADDDFSAVDVGTSIGGNFEADNLYDATYNNLNVIGQGGALQFPSERSRYFVTPLDPTGNGAVVGFDNPPSYQIDNTTGNLIIDQNTATLPQPQAAMNVPATGTGPDRYGRVGFYHYFRPPGLPPGVAQAPDLAHNPFHGFESYRHPAAAFDATKTNLLDPLRPRNAILRQQAMGAMPYNIYDSTTQNVAVPTYDLVPIVNSSAGPSANYFAAAPPNPAYADGYQDTNTTQRVFGGYPLGTLGVDEAHEMNLYAPSQYDAPYGPGDLEWLYRQQDSDGSSLHSRLAQLAPISFLNPKDGKLRRQLFSLESWDTTAFMMNGSVDVARNLQWIIYYNFAAPADYDPANPEPNALLPGTPALAHRDRKINLNFPLPPQITTTHPDPAGGGGTITVQAYDEPVRQKWVREAYWLMRAVLPNSPPVPVNPTNLALGYNYRGYTAADCAALSQFLLNVIDFRDPDAVHTRFINPEIVQIPAIHRTTTPPGNALEPPRLVFAADLFDNPTLGTTADPDAKFVLKTVGGKQVIDPQFYLEQWGMEHNPIAINEALAFQYDYTTGTPAQRLYLELVNTLTVDGRIDETASPIAPAPLVPSLDVQGWEVLVLPDDPTGRPDPITGQVPKYVDEGAIGTVITPSKTTPIGQTGGTWMTPTAPATQVAPVPAITADASNIIPNPLAASPYYYTMGVDPQAGDQSPPLNPDMRLDPALLFGTARGQLNPLPSGSGTGTGTGRYVWIYLLRPADPSVLPQPTATGYPLPWPNTPSAPLKVVVDAIRVPYIEGSAKASGGAPTVPIYSFERFQPYRGGHNVRHTQYVDSSGTTQTTTTYLPRNAYGYSEECSPPIDTGGGGGGGGGTPTLISKNSLTGKNGTTVNTLPIGETLKWPNDNNPNRDLDTWDYLPFHDRDFMGVTELLLVPGCPPGLFTKQFVENDAPDWTSSGPAPVKPDIANNPPTDKYGAKLVGSVDAYPYLVDRFYYSDPPLPYIDPDPASPTYNTLVYNYTLPQHDGWHTMLEYFEVPSPSLGATAPVATGSNLDWLRQDVKPGQLNLNLIVDEEVFFGLIDDPRLNQMISLPANAPQVVTQIDQFGQPITAATANPGMPAGTYSLVDPTAGVARGYFQYDTFSAPTVPPTGTYNATMKQAFSDFLKLRHGGSSSLFAFGTGAVPSTPVTPTNPPPGTLPLILPTTSLSPPPDRPFRGGANTDINATVMRPAFQPQSDNRNPTATVYYSDIQYTAGGYQNSYPSGYNLQYTKPDLSISTVVDLGLRVTAVGAGAAPQQLFVPPRRLFQVPDDYNPSATPPKISGASVWPMGMPIYAPAIESNNGVSNATPNGGALGGIPSLFLSKIADPRDTVSVPPTRFVQNVYLGGALKYNPTAAADGNNYYDAPIADRRQHPAWRTEALEKVANLTTTRTHQYAVWVTVGFFEVVRAGNPQAANIPVANWPLDSTGHHIDPAADQLGPELGLAAGRNIRYRSFFLLDRTRATGFNPANPGDFRELITYRRRIE